MLLIYLKGKDFEAFFYFERLSEYEAGLCGVAHISNARFCTGYCRNFRMGRCTFIDRAERVNERIDSVIFPFITTESSPFR